MTASLILGAFIVGYGSAAFITHWTRQQRIETLSLTIRRLAAERDGLAVAHKSALERVRRLEAEAAEMNRETFFGPRVVFGVKPDLRVVDQ